MLLIPALLATMGCGGADPDRPRETPSSTHAQTVCDGNDVSVVLANNQCTLCHNDTPEVAGGGLDLLSDGLEERLANRYSANPTCANELLTNPDEPGASMLLRVVAPERYADFGSPDCVPVSMPLASPVVMPDADVTCMEAWIANLDPKVDERDVPAPGDPFTALTKVKYILHGGAITAEELERVTGEDGQIDHEQLHAVVGEWMETGAFRDKRQTFLRLALQQTPGDTNYYYQFRNTQTAVTRGLRDNLQDSMIRTAERIIDNGEDFRTIVTTNEWEVTTLLLLALKMADNPIDGDRNRKNNPMNDIKYVLSVEDPAYDSDLDAEDWRTVTLVHDPSSSHMMDGEDFLDHDLAQELRDIPDGGSTTVRSPRIGFFTTPAFYQNWLTNPDNQFRVTVNQALLVALGMTFTEGDPTPRNTGDEGVDLELFPYDSTCYGCHKNMEAMRVTFWEHYDATYSRQYVPSESFAQADFSFQGYSEPVDDLHDWALAVTHHPSFAKAWVLKLCQWANSTVCDPNHPLVTELAEGFEQSGYRMDDLFQDLFASPLVTNTSYVEENRIAGAEVTIAREEHFCAAMRVRLQDVVDARDRSSTDRTDVCNKGDQDLLSQSIPNEEWTRGEAAFHQPRTFGTMSSISFEALCAVSAANLVDGNKVFAEGDPDETLRLMTSLVLGFPEGTPRYDAQIQVMHQLYETQTASPRCADAASLEAAFLKKASCGLELESVEALRNMWTMVCQSPSLSGVGL